MVVCTAESPVVSQPHLHCNGIQIYFGQLFMDRAMLGSCSHIGALTESALCAQTGRFSVRLVAEAGSVFAALTRLCCTHANRDVRAAAEAALSAALHEASPPPCLLAAS